MTTPREVPPCKPWCGKGGFCDVNHPGECLSGSSPKLDDPCLCSEACAEAGRALNPPPSSPPSDDRCRARMMSDGLCQRRKNHPGACSLKEAEPSSPPSEGVPAKRLELTVRPWAPGFMQLGFAEAVGHSDIDLALRTAGFQDGDRIVIALAPAASPQSEAAPKSEHWASCISRIGQPCNCRPAAPRPGKPTGVEVGQRWVERDRRDYCPSPYTVIGLPDSAGICMCIRDGIDHPSGYNVRDVLRDEYLGMAAPAPEGPPAEPAAAPGAPEMTLGEAVSAMIDGKAVEYNPMGGDPSAWIGMGAREATWTIDGMRMLTKSKFRLKPVPPPVQRSRRVAEVADEWLANPARAPGGIAPALRDDYAAACCLCLMRFIADAGYHMNGGLSFGDNLAAAAQRWLGSTQGGGK